MRCSALLVLVCALKTLDVSCLESRALPKHRRNVYTSLLSVPDGGDYGRGTNGVNSNSEKRVVFIRHGRTYMNEYLGEGGTSFGAPNFSDVFSKEDNERYLDTPLSPTGIAQAEALAVSLKNLSQGEDSNLEIGSNDKDFLSELDLIVVSPLSRAIETMKIGLLPVLESASPPPIIALPVAAERVYLISDIGRSRSVLEAAHGDVIDFDSAFRRDGDLDEEWWFGLDDDAQSRGRATPSGITTTNYIEWRPIGENQEYACPGEPDKVFQQRMIKLYCWLRDRTEQTIAVVCHFGVIEWMLDLKFRNCELQVVPFAEIKPLELPEQELVGSNFSRS